MDAGYPATANLLACRADGVRLVAPIRRDSSRHTREGSPYARDAFTIDFDQQHAICPQGHRSATWNPGHHDGHDVITISFPLSACLGCPARPECTTSQQRPPADHGPTPTPTRRAVNQPCQSRPRTRLRRDRDQPDPAARLVDRNTPPTNPDHTPEQAQPRSRRIARIGQHGPHRYRHDLAGVVAGQDAVALEEPVRTHRPGGDYLRPAACRSSAMYR